MWLRRSLSWLVILALLLPAPSTSLARAQAATPALGGGARFLPSDTEIYLAGNLNPASAQVQYLDRLAGFYLQSPEVDRARQGLMAPLALDGTADPEVVWDEITAWIGDEVFVAFPRADDVGRLAGSDNRVSLDCAEAQMLVGVAVGDRAGFLAFVEKYDRTLGDADARLTRETIGGLEILALGGTPEGGALYLAMQDDYLLLSTVPDLLVQAAERGHADSLAATPAFREAATRFGSDSLAFLYANTRNQEVGFSGGGLSQRGATEWAAGALRLGEESVRVDVSTAMDSERMTPATRALAAKRPNPLRATGVVPAESSFFVGWDNVKLMWEQVKESFPPEDYAQARQDLQEQTSIDLEADIFDWMTGEFAVFASPSHEPTSTLGPAGIGIVVEAKDRALVKQKLEKVLSVLRQVEPRLAPTQQEIAGQAFYRVPLGEDEALFAQVVDGWLVVASSSGVAADTVAGIHGQGGLHRQPEAELVRAALPDPLTYLGYIAVPELAAITSRAVGAAAGDTSGADAFVRPIRSVGLGVNTTLERLDASLYAHVVVPEDGWPAEALAPETVSSSFLPVRIDASKHGGAWWSPDEQPGRGQLRGPGAVFQRFLRDEAGVSTSLILPDQRVGRQPTAGRFDPSVVQPSEPLVVRVGTEGTYTRDELQTYRDYVLCGGKLLLLSDGRDPVNADALAEVFGMRVGGTVRGEGTLDTFVPHPLTQGAEPLLAVGGTGLLQWDEHTRPVGFLSSRTFLDLNGNGVSDKGEPWGAPALAVRPYGRGLVVFLGTSSAVQHPGHPLVKAVLHDLLPDAPWPGDRRRVPADLATMPNEVSEQRAAALENVDPIAFVVEGGRRTYPAMSHWLAEFAAYLGPEGNPTESAR